jgi:hypothetical protein
MGRGQVLSVHYCGKMVKAKTQLFDCYVLTFDFDNFYLFRVIHICIISTIHGNVNSNGTKKSKFLKDL